MQNRKYKEGDVINHWTINGYDTNTKKYICICVCGNYGKVKASSLGKVSKSCGCMQKETITKKIKENGFMSIKNKIYDNYKRAALKRDYSFELTKEEFNLIISQKCHYCKTEPNMVYKYGRSKSGNELYDIYNEYKYNGVDRVNNSLGYVKNNCVACCKICNNSKSTLSISEWQEWIIRVHDNYIVRFND